MVKYAVSDDGKNGQIRPKSLFGCIRDGAGRIRASICLNLSMGSNLSMWSDPMEAPWKPNSHVLFAYQDIVPALFEGSASPDMLRLKCDASATDVGDRCGESVVLYRLRTVYERIFERELRELPMRLRLAKTCYATMLSEAIERWHGTGVDEDSKAWFLMHLQDVLTKELVEPGRINDERLGKLRSDIAFQLGI